MITWAVEKYANEETKDSQTKKCPPRDSKQNVISQTAIFGFELFVMSLYD